MTQPATANYLALAEEYLQPYIDQLTRPELFRLDVWVTSARFRDAVQTLFDHQWGYLCAITGVDRPFIAVDPETPAQEDQIEVLYHFAEGEGVVTIHVLLPYSRLSIPSLCDLIPSASMYERELMEMLGVDCVGTPSREKLVLPDEWPDGVYPLRKSFKGLNPVNMEEVS
ncbi:MAG: NADH-quinone oxidoreductase subunit C [Anaerolineae bacterium]|nr:NADH-quinone oxidoreductase subunit C [Anaerolineae bacterium]